MPKTSYAEKQYAYRLGRQHLLEAVASLKNAVDSAERNSDRWPLGSDNVLDWVSETISDLNKAAIKFKASK